MKKPKPVKRPLSFKAWLVEGPQGLQPTLIDVDPRDVLTPAMRAIEVLVMEVQKKPGKNPRRGPRCLRCHAGPELIEEVGVPTFTVHAEEVRFLKELPPSVLKRLRAEIVAQAGEALTKFALARGRLE